MKELHVLILNYYYNCSLTQQKLKAVYCKRIIKLLKFLSFALKINRKGKL